MCRSVCLCHFYWLQNIVILQDSASFVMVTRRQVCNSIVWWRHRPSYPVLARKNRQDRERFAGNHVWSATHYVAARYVIRNAKPITCNIYMRTCESLARGIIHLFIDSPNFRVACRSLAQTLWWRCQVGAKWDATHDMDVIVTIVPLQRSRITTVQQNPMGK